MRTVQLQERRRRKSPVLQAICVLAVCLLATCSDSPEETTHSAYSLGADGEWPVGKVYSELERGAITFYPAPDADWRQLIDMTIFEGFRPGMTFKEARQKVGPPDLKGTGPLGPYWIYKRSGDDVRLSHEDMGSFFPFKWWILMAFVRSTSGSQLLHENVRKEIPAGKSTLTVVIMNNQHHPGAFVEMRDGQIISIHWPNNPGSDPTST